MFKKNILNLLISYIGLFVGLFTVYFKPKVLTSEEIGIFSTIVSITLVLQIFSYGGILGVIMKFYPKYKDTEHLSKFITSIIATSYFMLAIVIFILFMIKSLILSYYGTSSLEEYFIFIPLYLLLSHTLEVYERLSRVLFISVKTNVIRNIYFKIINCLFLIYMYLNKTSFLTYLIFFMILNSVTTLQMILVCNKYLNVKWTLKNIKPDYKFLIQFVSYAFFIMISSLSGTITSNIDKIMIGHYLNFSKTGIYTIAITISSTMNIIFDSFSRISQPNISMHLENKDLRNLKKTYTENLFSNLHFGVYVFTILVIFSEKILFFIGKEYAEGSYVIIIIAVGQLFNIFSGMCGEIISLSKFYRFDFYLRIVLIIVTISSNIIFIPAFGITGAAIATSISFIIYDILKIVYTYKKFNIHPFTVRNLYFFVSGLLIALPLIILNNNFQINFINFLFLSLFAFLLYDIILGYLFKYEFSIVKKINKKYLVRK